MNFRRGVSPRSFRAWAFGVVAFAAVYAFASPSANAATIEPLEIVTKSGVQVFSVEMATTEEEKTTGLMYRKELATGRECCSISRRNSRCRCG